MGRENSSLCVEIAGNEILIESDFWGLTWYEGFCRCCFWKKKKL